MPFELIQQWLQSEQDLGVSSPNFAVLSTCDNDTPHSRVVAIREYSEAGFLFFTQGGTRKTTEMANNNQVSLNYWLSMSHKQIIIEGEAEPISDEANAEYWQGYPKVAQARFAAYAPTSSQPISDKQILEDKLVDINATYSDKPIPTHTLYKGYLVKPLRITFYHYRTDELSDVFDYHLKDGEWSRQILSP